MGMPSKNSNDPMPPTAWAWCVVAFVAPILAWWASGAGDPLLLGFYLWAGSLLPAYVVARHGGRRGALVTVVVGVVIVASGTAFLAGRSSPLPDWRIAGPLVAVFAGVAMGFGVAFERIAKARAQAAQTAVTDALTGLANRGRTQRLLDEAFQASRDGRPLTLALLELDRFRVLNDQHGHVAGDRVLRTVGRLLADSLRASETVGRWSGSEFLVILPGSDLQTARQRIEEMMGRLAGVDLQWRPVSLSGGIASLDSGAQTADGLVSLADAALMRAQSLGGDRVEVVDADHGVERYEDSPATSDPPPASAPAPTATPAPPGAPPAASAAPVTALDEAAPPTSPTAVVIGTPGAEPIASPGRRSPVDEEATSARIVVVDDDSASLRAFQRGLTALGFSRVAPFTDPEEALVRIEAHGADLILLDLHMDPLDGFGVLQRLRPTLDQEGFLPVIVLTGERDPKVKERALRMGARDFLTKPVDLSELHARILNLLETRTLHRQVSEAAHGLEDRVRERTRELEEARAEILARLARAAEYRDDATGRHQERVGEISALLADYMGLDPERIDVLRQAAPLHDIGKIGIPDSILRKPGPLTPGEYARMKQHTRLGAELLSGSTNQILETAAVVAASHHERWDGSGYPAGLKGEAIPVEGRIVAVADAFDSLTHRRTYKAAVPLAITMERLVRDAGTALDPGAAEALEHLYRTGQLEVFVEEPA